MNSSFEVAPECATSTHQTLSSNATAESPHFFLIGGGGGGGNFEIGGFGKVGVVGAWGGALATDDVAGAGTFAGGKPEGLGSTGGGNTGLAAAGGFVGVATS